MIFGVLQKQAGSPVAHGIETIETTKKSKLTFFHF